MGGEFRKRAKSEIERCRWMNHSADSGSEIGESRDGV